MSAENLTLEQMEARRDELEESIASLKAKLDNVRAKRHLTGEYADPDWYRRTTTRLRFTGVEHQKLCRQIAALKRTQRAAHEVSVERAFVAEARKVLSDAAFAAIMINARRIASAGAPV